MKTGQIYKWETDKIRGYEFRYKYHLYIGKDASGRNVFLFVNTKNYYDEGFELKNTDYPFFQKASSYIGCGTTVVSYSDSEIAHVSDNDLVGELMKKDIDALIEHIGRSEIMERRFIKFIVGKLRELN